MKKCLAQCTSNLLNIIISYFESIIYIYIDFEQETIQFVPKLIINHLEIRGYFYHLC